MSTTVSFSFKTEEEKQNFIEYARSKGMTLSALVKMALYQYRAKYPHREARNGGVAKDCGDTIIGAKTVQPQAVGGSGDDGRGGQIALGGERGSEKDDRSEDMGVRTSDESFPF
jgi:hypothetical protein